MKVLKDHGFKMVKVYVNGGIVKYEINMLKRFDGNVFGDVCEAAPNLGSN